MKCKNIFIGADHAGFKLKKEIRETLDKRPATSVVMDLSPKLIEGDDYPEIATQVAKLVAGTPGSRGVLICGSGVGVTMAANRIKGVRAFDAYDAETVKLAREHNDANVIALSGWRQSAADAKKLLKIFFATEFSKTPRHHRRVKMLG
ncbi:RpiB/LacA/LacB family sugar-phosphate isomerase [Candidatus Uhrbacteria bacterium]|nr:RpiB/LacA/LacB family sugar-phosphate isomerase [Candidatus Uhrbacteria bacterium]